MSWYLFFMSLSAGVALLQPTLLSATDQLVKPEEGPLEVAQEAAASPSSGLLKGQEKKEQQQKSPQPTAPSGFSSTLLNGTGNLIKLLNVAFIGGVILGLFFFNTIPKGYLFHEIKKRIDAPIVFFAVYFLVAFFAKLGFYFFKGYAWVKRHPTAFMVGLQLLLLTILFGLELWISKSNFFGLRSALTAIWLPIIYFPMALFDLWFSALWQRSWLSSCLLG